MNASRIQLVSAVLLLCLCAGEKAGGDVKVIDLGSGQFIARFVFDAPQDASSVHVAGTFNQWSPKALPMNGPDAKGQFVVEFPLTGGRHEYKYVVNGNIWFTDPGNPLRIGPNDNSVLLLGEDQSEEPSNTGSGHAESMPGLMEHPRELKKILANRGHDQDSRSCYFEEWARANPRPFFTKSTVTFIAVAPMNHTVRLNIYTRNSRFGYDLLPLVEDADDRHQRIRGVSLDRIRISKYATYLLEVTDGAHVQLVDPNAWSITSRAGRPVGRVIEPSPTAGCIKLVEDMKPTESGLQPRDVYVYLPPGYTYPHDRETHYPVVYMHDGQNCWDDPTEPFGHGGWSINLTADKLINSGEVEPFIAVGIANTPDRLKEYGPGSDILSADTNPYLQFIAKTLKPLIDKKYRTLPGPEHTALMGSSMGGAISFQGALLMPDVFGSAACLSTALMFKDASERGYSELVESCGKQPVRLYLDSGTGGRHQDGAPATRAMVELLKQTGWKLDDDLEHFEDEGADHNERAWRARVDRPLRFLFGKD